MTKTLRHKFQSAVADVADATLVRPISNWDDEHNLWYGFRKVTTTSDTIADSDNLSLVRYNSASPIAVSFPAPTTGPPATMPLGWTTLLFNQGAGLVTVTGSGATMNGAATLALNQNEYVRLFSDGSTDYFALATRVAVSSDYTTGDVKFHIKNATDAGWIQVDNGTIGDASSGASNRANADCQALYSLFWFLGDNICPVTGGRGASDVVDWTAHKPIRMPLLMQRSIGVAGAGAGLTSRQVGAAAGGESWSPTSANMFGHAHTMHYGAGNMFQNLSIYAYNWQGDSSTGNLYYDNLSYDGTSGANPLTQPSNWLQLMIKL